MNIQSNINSTFSLIGLLATQSPKAAARREEAAKEFAKQQQLKNIQKKQAIIGEGSQQFAKQFEEQLKKTDEATTAEDLEAGVRKESEILGGLGEYREASLHLAQQTFDLDPTFENFQAVKLEEAKVKGFSEMSAQVAKSLEDIEAEKAAKALEAEQTRVSKKRNFLDYIGDEPVSLGGQPFGTVKDIGSDVSKKAIRGAYTKKEKTEIMNRKDEKNG